MCSSAQYKFLFREGVACRWEVEVNSVNWRGGVCKVLQLSLGEESFSRRRAVEMEGREAEAAASEADFVLLSTTVV